MQYWLNKLKRKITLNQNIKNIHQSWYCKRHYKSSLVVMVIVVGNGHSDTSSNPGHACLHIT